MTKEEFMAAMTNLGAKGKKTKGWIRFAKEVYPHNKAHRERIYDAAAARTENELQIVL